MPQSPAFLITVLVFNLLTDVCIILIPIPIILPLKISLGRKLGLLFMFCAGVFIMIAAILRVYFVLVVSAPTINSSPPKTDTCESFKKEKRPPSGLVEKMSSLLSSVRPL